MAVAWKQGHCLLPLRGSRGSMFRLTQIVIYRRCGDDVLQILQNRSTERQLILGVHFLHHYRRRLTVQCEEVQHPDRRQR